MKYLSCRESTNNTGRHDEFFYLAVKVKLFDTKRSSFYVYNHKVDLNGTAFVAAV